MSRKSAGRKHDLTADEHQKHLVKLIGSFSHGHHLHSVFSDFVELSALAISNGVDLSQYEGREKRYLDIVGKYKREEIERFPQMFAALTESFEMRVRSMRKPIGGGNALASGGLTDVLGETYMMLELGNARSGQFFTPYHVSRMMAMMTIGDGGDAVKQNGFLRLQEPACGAGGMVIAVAESLSDAGLNYQQSMHATCIDIDPCCVHIAYIQLSLLHIPAVVVHGNALSMEVWGMWYTPAHIMGGWRWKLRERESRRNAPELEAAPALGNECVDQIDPDDLVVRASDASLEVVDEGEVAVVERPAIIEMPRRSIGEAQVAGPASTLATLFEEAVARTASSASIFETIDQFTLF